MTLRQLFSSPAHQWAYFKLPSAQIAHQVEVKEVLADEEYLSITARSLRVINVRKGLSTFYGAIHSQIRIPTMDGEAEINVFTSPSDLQKVDAGRIDRVIVKDIPLMESVPYRGGKMDIQFGLFSIKAGEFVGPFIEVLSSLSDAAGVGIISKALDYAKPLNKGIELLTGSSDSSILEIGLSTTYQKIVTGVYLVMRADRDEINEDELFLDNDFNLVGPNKKSIKDYPYFVFEISSKPHRGTIVEIPELAASYKVLKASLAARDKSKIEEARTNFKFAVYSSPELLPHDASTIFDKYDAEIQKILASFSMELNRGRSAQTAKEPFKLTPLEEIDLR